MNYTWASMPFQISDKEVEITSTQYSAGSDLKCKYVVQEKDSPTKKVDVAVELGSLTGVMPSISNEDVKQQLTNWNNGQPTAFKDKGITWTITETQPSKLPADIKIARVTASDEVSLNSKKGGVSLNGMLEVTSQAGEEFTVFIRTTAPYNFPQKSE